MPITQSAKKAIRQSAKKRVYNLRRAAKVDDAVRKLKKLVAAGSKEVKTALSTVYKAVDKAAKGNTLSKGTAARMKSRLNAFVKRSVQK